MDTSPQMFKRRYRATPSQVRLLETYFIEDETPDAGRREFIAQHADMPVKSVHIWFQNRRAKKNLELRKAGRPIPPRYPSLHNFKRFLSLPNTYIFCTAAGSKLITGNRSASASTSPLASPSVNNSNDNATSAIITPPLSPSPLVLGGDSRSQHHLQLPPRPAHHSHGHHPYYRPSAGPASPRSEYSASDHTISCESSPITSPLQSPRMMPRCPSTATLPRSSYAGPVTTPTSTSHHHHHHHHPEEHSTQQHLSCATLASSTPTTTTSHKMNVSFLLT
ncbi:hypothetical protein H4R33_003114 [Dimargaris cristalligena]|nr:hypothetical protein H4R33_003114 [Dimargaris cristalligena]